MNFNVYFQQNNKMFVKHKCPCPHKVQITGLFSKLVTIQAKTLGLLLLWKNIYTRNGSGWACIILIAHSMGTIGKYIDTKIALKKLVKGCMQIICFRLQRIGKCVSQSKTRVVIFVYGTTWKAHTWLQACRLFSFCKFSLKSKQQLNRSKWTNEKQVWPPLMTHSPE